LLWINKPRAVRKSWNTELISGGSVTEDVLVSMPDVAIEDDVYEI
jgi:hypothetical protein